MEKKDHAVIMYNNITDQSTEDMKDILRQVEWVEQIVEDLGYSREKLKFDIADPGFLKNLREKPRAFIFNLVEACREEESIAYLAGSLFELLGLKYTGSSVEGILTTTDKVLSKILMRRAGIPTPAWVFAGDCLEFVPECRYIIKPVREDASVGIFQSSVILIHDLEQLSGILKERQENEGFDFFAEQYIEGREFDVLLLSGEEKVEALPPLELIFKGFQENHLEQLYSYDGKWGANTFESDNVTLVIAEDNELSETLKKIARDCWGLFQLSGYGKVDFRVDQNGTPYVLEVNANPSFYGFYQYEKAGMMTMREVVQRIISAALEQG